MHAFDKKRGITLLEIIVSIAILSILFGTLSTPFLNYYRKVVLQGATEQVMAMLDEARKSTLSSYKSSQYGVHFETTKVVLFAGDTYSAVDPDNDIYLFSGGVRVLDIALTDDASDVVFERITGETSKEGTITIDLPSYSTFSTITIYGSGLVEVQ